MRYEEAEPIILFLELGVEVDATDNRGRTALWYAGERGRKGVEKVLMDAGANEATRYAETGSMGEEDNLEYGSSFSEPTLEEDSVDESSSGE